MFVTVRVLVNEDMKQRINAKWTVNWNITGSVANCSTLASIKDAAKMALRGRLRACIKGQLPRSYDVLRVWFRVPQQLLDVNPDYPSELDLTGDECVTSVLRDMTAAKGPGGLCVVNVDIGYLRREGRNMTCSAEIFTKKVRDAGLHTLITVKKEPRKVMRTLSSMLATLEDKAHASQPSADATVTALHCKACATCFHQVDEMNKDKRVSMCYVTAHVAACGSLAAWLTHGRRPTAALRSGVQKAKEAADKHRTQMRELQQTKRKRDDAEPEIPAPHSTLQAALSQLPTRNPADVPAASGTTDAAPQNQSPEKDVQTSAPEPDLFVFHG